MMSGFKKRHRKSAINRVNSRRNSSEPTADNGDFTFEIFDAFDISEEPGKLIFLPLVLIFFYIFPRGSVKIFQKILEISRGKIVKIKNLYNY